jgi:hypothetical protein
MLKKRSVGVLLVLCLSALVFTGCDDDDWDDFWSDWDLEGHWTVREMGHTGEVLFTYEIFLDQHGLNVTFRRGGERLAEGTILNDRIHCDDWYDYDFNRIYIDSDRHMHSGPADHPAVDYLVFDRIH